MLLAGAVCLKQIVMQYLGDAVVTDGNSGKQRSMRGRIGKAVLD